MTLIVQKFGGTSMGSLERIAHVAHKVRQTRAQGHQVIAVVSAMAGETDRLIKLSKDITAYPDPREYAALISTGEQVSATLLAIALQKIDCPAKSYNARQIHIMTDNVFLKARILNINTDFIQQRLALGEVLVITGFQGVTESGDITTLGRGGSDTTAVALASALNATECQIYTDVEGVYTADPRVVSKAKLLTQITFEEMMEMAGLGAKVLQSRSVEFIGKYKIPVRVLSSFTENSQGTLITFEDSRMEKPLVSGIAFNRNEAKLTITGVPHTPDSVFAIIYPIAENNIDIDMIVQNIAIDNKIDLTFTVQRDDYQQAFMLLKQVATRLGATEVTGNLSIAKLSVIGVGMRSHAGIARTMFQTLATEGITTQLITTSEIKISVAIDEKYLELGARALHTAFGLDIALEEEK